MAKAPRQKPAKPWPTFPLTPHARGQWVKKIHGKLHWFGPWEDADGAHQRYLAKAKSLHAGESPPADPAFASVKEIANRFLALKLAESNEGKIVKSWYAAYFQAAERFTRFVGASTLVSELTPDHFAGFLASRGGEGVNKTVQCIRALFNHATGEGWCKPVYMGKRFKKESRGAHRSGWRKKLFTGAECQIMLDKAPDALRAMILLALNGGMGQSDVATLRVGDVDFAGKVIDYHRQKTGVARVVPLWPETVKAIRPFAKGKSDGDLIFVTELGNAWVREQPSIKSPGKVTTVDSVSLQFAKLMKKTRIWPDEKSDGRAFYTLRRTFRTVADAQGDQRAIDLIMGHAPIAADMGAVYVQQIDRTRLDAVVNHVQASLLKKKKVKDPQRLKGQVRKTS